MPIFHSRWGHKILGTLADSLLQYVIEGFKGFTTTTGLTFPPPSTPSFQLGLSIGCVHYLCPLDVTVGCARWLCPLAVSVGCIRWLFPLAVPIGCPLIAHEMFIGCIYWHGPVAVHWLCSLAVSIRVLCLFIGYPLTVHELFLAVSIGCAQWLSIACLLDISVECPVGPLAVYWLPIEYSLIARWLSICYP